MNSAILNKTGGADGNTQGAHLVEIDIMKFFGILLVVLGHVATTYTPISPINPNVSSDLMVNIKNLIYMFHMPMFIFISGYIFSYQLEIKKKQMSLSSLFINKSKRLLIPYYVFGFCWVLPVMVGLGFRKPLEYAINGILLTSDCRHLWFVFALFGIFILFFLLRILVRQLHLPSWTVLFIGIILYIIPMDYIPFFQLWNIKNYFIWFAVGYFAILHRKTSLAVLIIACVSIVVDHISNIMLPPLVKNSLLAIIGIGIIYITSIIVSKKTIINKLSIYKLINRNSFGIYLFHAMLIYIFEFIASPYSINPLVLSIIVFAISLILSILLTELTRRIGLGIIIGEKRYRRAV